MTVEAATRHSGGLGQCIHADAGDAATKHAVEGYSDRSTMNCARGVSGVGHRASIHEDGVQRELHAAGCHARRVSRGTRGRDQESERGDGNGRTARRRGRDRAEGGQRGASQNPIRGGQTRELPAIARRFAPAAGVVDAGLRKDLQLDDNGRIAAPMPRERSDGIRPDASAAPFTSAEKPRTAKKTKALVVERYVSPDQVASRSCILTVGNSPRSASFSRRDAPGR
jgi:hypothetical protein